MPQLGLTIHSSKVCGAAPLTWSACHSPATCAPSCLGQGVSAFTPSPPKQVLTLPGAPAVVFTQTCVFLSSAELLGAGLSLRVPASPVAQAAQRLVPIPLVVRGSEKSHCLLSSPALCELGNALAARLLTPSTQVARVDICTQVLAI